MNNCKYIPVILCGGSGTRLWPLSRTNFPKQFLSLNNRENTLFQETVQRAINLGMNQIIVITNEAYRFMVLDQLLKFPQIKAKLILEPYSKNTAPAVTLAALDLIKHNNSTDDLLGEDVILFIMPSDHNIGSGTAFNDAVLSALDDFRVSDNSEDLISVMGIPPTSAETGYGYIKTIRNSREVEEFVEKPSAEMAKSFMLSGDYYWNSGMLMMRANTWCKAIKQFRPDIYHSVKKAWSDAEVDYFDGSEFIRPNHELFNMVPSESIDYAVLEKCLGANFKLKMKELVCGWSDLGSWDSVWQVNEKDSFGNSIVGDSKVMDTKNSLIRSTSRLVGVVGVSNLIVIETPDCVMVADRNKSQDIKLLVAELEKDLRIEQNLHRKVFRPWGWYDELDDGPGFKVKRIQVKPNESISLQKHRFRSEHWIVVKGAAQIINGEASVSLKENESTYIPAGQIHRLSNPESSILEIIEVQVGSYLGEDDIVRLEDRYGRI